jgi:PQQ-like domain
MRFHRLSRRLAAAVITAITLLACTYFVVMGGTAAWPVYQHDFNRTGVDRDDPQATAVSAGWNTQLDGAIYAQPLFANNIVYAATENDTVYGLDANSGAMLWRQHLGTPVPASQLACAAIDPYGITSTPVVDTANGVLYTLTEQSTPSIHHELYALNLKAGGSVLYHFPVDVAGSDPRYQRQRGALTLANGRVYVPFGGFDCGNYVGRVVGVKTGDAAGASLISYTLPNTKGGSIWAAGSTDGSGNLYFSTGNSSATGSTPDRGESVVILSPTLQELAFWTAPEWRDLNINDLDIGSIGPILLNNGWILQAGKGGKGYLMSSAHMGGVGGQLFEGVICDSPDEAVGFGTYQPPSTIYMPCVTSLKRIDVNTTGTPSFTVTTVRGGYGGGTNGPGVSPPMISGGVLWTLDVGNRLLIGLNANTGQAMFSQPLAGTPTHFAAPSAASGHIFVPAGSILEAFSVASGSTPPPPPSTATPTPTAATQATYTSHASGAPNQVPVGTTSAITATVTSTQTETNLIDLEVYDPSWNKVFQQYWDSQSFVAGQPRTFTSSAWQVPTTAPTGAYHLAIGVYHQGWGTVKNWNPTAGSVTVVPAFTNSASASPTTVHPGGTIVINSSVKSAGASTALVDVEVWDPSGNRAGRQFWDPQSFTPGQTRNYVTYWAPAATAKPGTYTVTVGEFSTDGTVNYDWNNATTVTVN